jgi:hypothetical protein
MAPNDDHDLSSSQSSIDESAARCETWDEHNDHVQQYMERAEQKQSESADSQIDLQKFKI